MDKINGVLFCFCFFFHSIRFVFPFPQNLMSNVSHIFEALDSNRSLITSKFLTLLRRKRHNNKNTHARISHLFHCFLLLFLLVKNWKICSQLHGRSTHFIGNFSKHTHHCHLRGKTHENEQKTIYRNNQRKSIQFEWDILRVIHLFFFFCCFCFLLDC